MKNVEKVVLGFLKTEREEREREKLKIPRNNIPIQREDIPFF